MTIQAMDWLNAETAAIAFQRLGASFRIATASAKDMARHFEDSKAKDRERRLAERARWKLARTK